MKSLRTISIALVAMLLALCACQKNEPAADSVTDICGNTYKTVKIGNQIWMAENLACTKYDTESELAGGVIAEGDGKGSGYQPYYVDSRIKEKWTDGGKFAGNITDEQIKKLGLLYNWAAAMGYATAEEAWNKTGTYDGNRQGICPNGWHLPSQDEWDLLETTVRDICGDEKTGFEARHLKSKTGWASKEGITSDDALNFCALPAGESNGSQIICVGAYLQIWTSTALTSKYQDEAFDEWFSYNSDDVVAFDSFKKNARSVRCVKN